MGLAISLALILALGFSGWRLASRISHSRRRRRLPAESAATAVVVRSFDEIDEWLTESRCACSGSLTSLGEASEELDGRRLRIVRSECSRCEEERSLYFDVTRIFN